MATVIAFPAVMACAAPMAAHAEAASYSIPSEDLKTALKALADASGRQIEFSSNDVAGKTSTAVVNAPSFSAALDTMLSGAGLTASVESDGAALVANPSKVKGAAVSAIVVTGRRLGQTAVELQLQAVNTTSVLTATDMARAPDNDVVSSLARVAGIGALNGGFGNTNGVPADAAGRGTANFLELRGLDTQYNTNFLNGVDVAQGMPYSRGVSLDLLPTTGLQKVVVNKTIGASMDGDAIGGQFNFVTPTAYDFEGESHGSLTLGGQVKDQALAYKLPAGGENIAFDYSHKFGDHDQLGIYFGGYYDFENWDNSIVDGMYPAEFNGMYTYAIQNSSGGSAAAPGHLAQNLVLTGLDAGITQGTTERFGGNVSIDWHPSTTLSGYSRLTYASDYVTQETSYLQIYGNNVGSQQIGNTGVYTDVINNLQPRYYYETSPQYSNLATWQVGGDDQIDRLHLAPNVFLSYGEYDEPNHIERGGRQPIVAAGVPYGGSTLFSYGSQGPFPTVSAGELANLEDIASYGAKRSGELTQEFSRQFIAGGKIDATYDIKNGWFDSIQAGLKYSDSYRHHSEQDYTSNNLYTTDANDPSLGSTGIFTSSVPSLIPGLYNFAFPIASLSKVFSAFDQAVKNNGGIQSFSDNCGSLYVNTYNCDTQSGTEAVASAYVQANLKFGDLQVIPGLRFEHTDIVNHFWDEPTNTSGQEIPGHFASDSSTYNEPLPSLFFNYRPNDQTVYRASITRTYVRPSMFQLGGGEQVSFSDGGPTAGGSESITLGNPKLKALTATNLDASGEWVNNHGSAFEVAGFYKEINNFIFSTVNGYTNANSVVNQVTASNAVAASSGSTGEITVTTPINGKSGSVYGLELTGSQKFIDMPAPFDGFGISGNVTLERSDVNTGLAGLSTHERLLNQADLYANGQFFYEKGPYHVDLSYNYSGPYVASYGSLTGSSQTDTWAQAHSELDLHASYMTPWKVRFEASISNLTDEDSSVYTIGKNTYTIPDYTIVGRTYYFKASYAF
jgi:TonB-dependent receptor